MKTLEDIVAGTPAGTAGTEMDAYTLYDLCRSLSWRHFILHYKRETSSSAELTDDASGRIPLSSTSFNR